MKIFLFFFNLYCNLLKINFFSYSFNIFKNIFKNIYIKNILYRSHNLVSKI